MLNQEAAGSGREFSRLAALLDVVVDHEVGIVEGLSGKHIAENFTGGVGFGSISPATSRSAGIDWKKITGLRKLNI